MVSCFAFAAVIVAPGFDGDTIREFMEMRIKVVNMAFLIAVMAFWHVLYSSFGLYDDLLFSNTNRKARDVLKATSIGICVIDC